MHTFSGTENSALTENLCMTTDIFYTVLTCKLSAFVKETERLRSVCNQLKVGFKCLLTQFPNWAKLIFLVWARSLLTDLEMGHHHLVMWDVLPWLVKRHEPLITPSTSTCCDSALIGYMLVAAVSSAHVIICLRRSQSKH